MFFKFINKCEEEILWFAPPRFCWEKSWFKSYKLFFKLSLKLVRVKTVSYQSTTLSKFYLLLVFFGYFAHNFLKYQRKFFQKTLLKVPAKTVIQLWSVYLLLSFLPVYILLTTCVFVLLLTSKSVTAELV